MIGIPCVIECVEEAGVGPRIMGGVEPILCWAVCFDFADEGERSIQVGVPCNGADRYQRSGGESRAGCERGLG